MSVVKSVPTEYAHIVRTPGVVAGEPRVDGRRITVRHIVAARDSDGLRPEQIAETYSLSLAEVYAALTFYEDHRAEIQELERSESRFVADFRQQHPNTVRVLPLAI